MTVEWLCARCAIKEGKETESGPTVLRLCTSCKIENWVRPYGHVGQDMVASEEEKQAALEKAIAESISVAEPEVIAETVPLEPEIVEVLKEAPPEESREAEIARLQALLKELKGEE
jgi:hypothetical protein